MRGVPIQGVIPFLRDNQLLTKFVLFSPVGADIGWTELGFQLQLVQDTLGHFGTIGSACP